jgi:GNAT superfamily N-acetyltransferase
MNPVWRLLRNRYTRAAYEALSAAGLTAARMVEFQTAIDAAGTGGGPDRPDGTGGAVDGPDRPDDGDGDADGPDGVSIIAARSSADRLECYDLDFAIPVTFLDEEWVVVATARDRAVGRVLVSAGQRPYVEYLDERIAFDGAYVRRVYVTPEWRNCGLATLLIREALGVGRRELGASTAHALIAADNRPSQWAFRANGFGPVRRYDYVSVFGREWRRTIPVGDR